MKEPLVMFQDLAADVRRDGRYHPIRALVQPDDPEVRAIAQALAEAPDFLEAAQEFVSSYTIYKRELGDFWRISGETLTAFTEYWEGVEQSELMAVPESDCDDKAILLCSILRNFIPADKVYCAFGFWGSNSDRGGHMWIIVPGENGEDRVIESTARPGARTRGHYDYMAIFNDQEAYATRGALREFDLKPIVDVTA